MLSHPHVLFNSIFLAFFTLLMSACGGAETPTTRGSNDSIKPKVIATHPATTAAVTSIIRVTFSEPVAAVQTDNITITPISVTGVPETPINFPQKDVLVLSDKDTVLNVLLANAAASVGNLVSNKQYLVKVQGIKDYAGNVMKGDCQWMFATIDANPTPSSYGGCDIAPGKLVFEFSTSNIKENIASGSAVVNVNRIRGTDGVVSVEYATNSISANDAIVGSDYLESKGTITFDDGDDTSKKIIIPIIDDTQTENNENFLVTLKNVSGGASIGSSIHTVTIEDDDIPPQGRFAFLLDVSSVTESSAGSNATIVVSRTGGSLGSVTVDYKTKNGTGSNAAIAGLDYTAKSSSLIFDAGVTSQSIIIPIIDNAQIEPTELFSIDLTAVTNGVLGTPITHAVSIIDDDQTTGSTVLSITENLKQLQFNWTPVSGATYNIIELPYSKKIASNISATTFNYDIPVHDLEWYRAYYFVETCVNGTCTESKIVSVKDLMLNSIGYFKASNTDLGDKFGSSVALSDDGKTLVAGAPFEDSSLFDISNSGSLPSTATDSNSAIDSGAVYVYGRDSTSGDWLLQSYIKASNVQKDDQFGAAVALSGDGLTLVVAAALEDSKQATISTTGNFPTTTSDDNSASDAGAVYVYSRTSLSAAWTQQSYIKASNSGAGDNFGKSVSLSNDGNTLAVGANNEDSTIKNVVNDNTKFPVPLNTESGTIDAGAAYIFSRNKISGVWVQKTYVKSSNIEANDSFGSSLALSGDGNTLIVGAIGEDGIGIATSNSGAAYLFTNDGTGIWTEAKYLKAKNPAANQSFGWSVDIDETALVVAVGAKDEIVVVPSPTGGAAGYVVAGAVYLFEIYNGAWTFFNRLTATNAKAGDVYGDSVSLSSNGSYLAIGTSGDNGNTKGVITTSVTVNNSARDAGSVYVLHKALQPNGTYLWRGLSYVKASNTNALDGFGNAVALNGDGSVLAVGAIGEAGDSTTVVNTVPDAKNLKPGAGAVYLY